MDQEKRTGSPEEQNPRLAPPEPKNAVHRLYDKIPLNIGQVNRIIQVTVAILVIVLAVGVLRANGYL